MREREGKKSFRRGSLLSGHSERRERERKVYGKHVARLSLSMLRKNQKAYQHVDREGHDKASHQQVGHGQGDDEKVGDVLQQLLFVHAEDDQDVAKDDDQAEEDQDNGPVVLGGGRGLLVVRDVEAHVDPKAVNGNDTLIVDYNSIHIVFNSQKIVVGSLDYCVGHK